MVENGSGGAPHTPKNFSVPKEVQSLPKTFFGHRDDVSRILEPSDPKIAYFGRKIADCKISGAPHPKNFSPLEIRWSISKNFGGFLAQF